MPYAIIAWVLVSNLVILWQLILADDNPINRLVSVVMIAWQSYIIYWLLAASIWSIAS